MTDEHVLTINRFQAGDKVPPWLIDVDPGELNSLPGVLTFGTEVDVIDCGDYYLVVPLGFGALPNLLQFTGAGCLIFASAKLVRVSTALATFETVDKAQWGRTGEQMGAIGYGGPQRIVLPPATPEQIAQATAAMERAIQAEATWMRQGGLFDAHVEPEGFGPGGQLRHPGQQPMLDQMRHMQAQLAKKQSLWGRIKAVFRP